MAPVPEYPSFDVQPRGEQPYVGFTGAVTMGDFAPVADRIPEIIGWLAERDVAPDGPPFFRYRTIDMDRELVITAGVPVAAPMAVDGAYDSDVLPAGRYVTTRYTGRPEDLVEVTGKLLAWAEQHGLSFDVSPSPDGDVWASRLELLETNPAEVPDPAQWRTTLAFRLAD